MQTFRTKLGQVETALREAGVYCGHGYESVSDEAVALLLGAAGRLQRRSVVSACLFGGRVNSRAAPCRLAA